MKLEKFNYSNCKRSRWFLYGVICTVALMVLINLFFSEAKYLKTESVRIAEGTINYKPYDFKIMAMYVENDTGNYEEADTMPTSGYVINEEKSYCTLDNVNKDSNAILKTNTNGEHIINNLSKNDKCYLYFDKKPMTIQDILATKTISTRNDFSTTLTEDTTGTIYSAEDDYGTSYYFAGAPTDNWVKFAGFYWRIIRINGDGTIRMIYQGESANTTGEETQIGMSNFNDSINNNAYVGYKYTIGEVHGISVDSTIKKVLDSWYNNNLASYTRYIATESGATFCNDRTPSTSNSSSNGSGGTGTTTTWYGAFYRVIDSSAPSLKCNKNDLFSTVIGLINADEVSYAGGVWMIDNTNYYLYTGNQFWTMSPYFFRTSSSDCSEIVPTASGSMYVAQVNEINAVRPVINLKAETTFADRGTGTAKNPYVVLGAD